MMRLFMKVIVVGITVVCAGVASGQDWPAKPIRIITGGVGGGSDFVGRLIAQRIAGPLGQSVLMDNRASGFVPGQVVANSPPDGYTILLYGATLYMETLLRADAPPYDTWKDFVPITLAVKEPSVLLVNKYLAVKDLKGLIALAKARPGELNYGGGGIGTTSSLGLEAFVQMTGIKVVRVSYKSSQQRFTELESGEVQLTIAGAAGAMPYVRSGRLRPLGVSTAEPSPLFPGVPIMASVAPNYEVSGMTALWAPAKTPDAIIRRLNREIVRALHEPELKEKLATAGQDIFGTSPEEFAAWLKVDIAKMAKMIKDSGFKRD